MWLLHDDDDDDDSLVFSLGFLPFRFLFARDAGPVAPASMRAREHGAEGKLAGLTGRSWSMSRKNCPEMSSSRVCLRPFFVLSKVLPGTDSMISSSGGL